MKCLSVLQPWADLLIHGIKAYETRDWKPPAAMIGQRIAIHAGKSLKGLLAFADPNHPSLLMRHAAFMRIDRTKPPVYGAILGTARLSFVLFTGDEFSRNELADEVLPTEKALGDWSHNRYCWRFTDHRPLADPIALRGQLGLFNLAPDVIELLHAQGEA